MTGVIRRGFSLLIPVVLDEDFATTLSEYGLDGVLPVLGIYVGTGGTVSITYKAKDLQGNFITVATPFTDFMEVPCVGAKKVNSSGTVDADDLFIIVGSE